MGDSQHQLSSIGPNGAPQPPSSGLMRKARSLDCFHRRIGGAGGASGLPSPRSPRRRLTLSKTPEEGIFDGGKDVCCLGGDRGEGVERTSPRRSSCDASGVAASRFSRAANRRFYHAAAKSASSGSLADLASESHGLSPNLSIDDEDADDVTAMLTAPGMGGPGQGGRARIFNVAVLALLGLAAASDLTRRGVVTASRVDWGVDSSSQFYYDDLSTEGIVPPSRFGPPYRSGLSDKSGGSGGRSKLGLGSAMIGSVTEALGPILPFAGGMDLRRGEAWGLDDDGRAGGVASGWIRGALDAMWEYKDASWGSWSYSSESSPADGVAQMPRGGAAGGARSKVGRNKSKGAKASVHREAALSAAEPFLPADAIAELNLGDITAVFNYAVESGREGFDRKAFMKRGGERGEPVSESLKRALDAMDAATAKSRGEGVEPAKTAAVAESFKDGVHESGPLSPETGFGDVDALQFCAAMRLFAEWRIIRQVPEGYKGYAVGMGLGHKDVVQNVVKIESAVHDLLLIQDEEMDRIHDETSCDANAEQSEGGGTQVCSRDTDPSRSGPPRSPTLRDLLQYEVDHRVQTPGKLPRLKEKSAAMGLLWVRRQLQYQTIIFSNMLKVGSVFPSAIDAVRSAYSEVYDKFHGWAVQKIFNYSFQAAPEAEVIYKHMNPSRLVEVLARARRGEVEHVGEIRFESTETTESETVTVASGEGEEERIVSEDTTVTRKTSMEESWDDESASSATEEKIHTHGGAKAQPKEEKYLDALTSNETEAAGAKASRGNKKDKDDNSENPWVKFGVHVASEWDKLVNHVGGECDKIGKHIGGEWDKLASNVVRIFHKDDEDNARGSPQGTDVRGGALSGNGGGLSGEELERYVSSQMAQDAHSHIERYLRIVRPLLTDLAGLFDEMNMDDPTKV